MAVPDQLLSDIRAGLADLPRRLADALKEYGRPPEPAPLSTSREVGPAGKPSQRPPEGKSGEGQVHDLAEALAKMGGLVPQLGELAQKLKDVLRFMEGLREFLKLVTPEKQPAGAEAPPGASPKAPKPPRYKRRTPTDAPWAEKAPDYGDVPDAEYETMRGRGLPKPPVPQLPYKADVPQLGYKPTTPKPLAPKKPKAPPAPPSIRYGTKQVAKLGGEKEMPKDDPTARLADTIEQLAEAVRRLERKSDSPGGGKSPEPEKPPIRYGTRKAAKLDMGRHPSEQPRTHAVERSENTVPYGELLGNVLGKSGGAAGGGEAAAAAAV